MQVSIQLAPTPLCFAIGMADWIRGNKETHTLSCEQTNLMDNEKLLHKSKMPFMSLDSLQPKGTILVSSRAVANSQVRYIRSRE